MCRCFCCICANYLNSIFLLFILKASLITLVLFLNYNYSEYKLFHSSTCIILNIIPAAVLLSVFQLSWKSYPESCVRSKQFYICMLSCVSSHLRAALFRCGCKNLFYGCVAGCLTCSSGTSTEICFASCMLVVVDRISLHGNCPSITIVRAWWYLHIMCSAEVPVCEHQCLMMACFD